MQYIATFQNVLITWEEHMCQCTITKLKYYKYIYVGMFQHLQPNSLYLKYSCITQCLIFEKN